jgi:hypothetical protein
LRSLSRIYADGDHTSVYLLNTCERTAPIAFPTISSRGLGAVALSYKFGSHFGVAAELAGQGLEYTLPRGLYPLGAITYMINRRLRFDAGLRFGVGAEAPRISVVAGLTIGVADLYGK